MRLVIAEKPDVARNIAKALNVTGKKNGYLEGGDYIISWCIGHLVELAEPEAYGDNLKKWTIEDLPIVPGTWQLKVKENTSKQYNVLKELMHDQRVHEIVCATDAGREGELIFRLLYEKANCKKTVKRLWVSSMEAAAILKAFDSLRDGREYDSLCAAALCRARADWLVGMNATRLYSVAYKKTLRMGRVQTPTLALVVDRQNQINSFVPSKYYILDALCGNFKASLKVTDKTAAADIQKKCNNKAGFITSVNKEAKKRGCPKLYDLGSLQSDANRIYGYSLQQTLDLTQALYEKALVTYPRTDSNYLTTETGSTVADRVAAVAGCECLGLSSAASTIIKEDFTARIGLLIKEDKVTDHHAIIPTLSVGKADNLPDSEKNILILVCTRFLAALSTPHEYEATTVILDCEGEAFKVSGNTVTHEGWKAIENPLAVDDEEKGEAVPTLPELYEGQTIERISVVVNEKDTQPPKLYTERELLKAMERAGNDVSDLGSEDEDYEKKGLGTSATRAGIVEALIKNGFLVRDGNKKVKRLIATDVGVKLVSIAPEELKSAHLTSEWEYYLQRIEQGKSKSTDFMADITEYVDKLVRTLNLLPVNPEDYFPSDAKESIGVCPRCGGNVHEGKKNFYCGNYKATSPCSFAIWKEDKYFTVRGIKQITKDQAKKLLSGGLVLKDIKAKSGAIYNAKFTLSIKDGKATYTQEFVNS